MLPRANESHEIVFEEFEIEPGLWLARARPDLAHVVSEGGL